MSVLSRSCPLSREQVLNLYYLEHRARLLDVAAFLDRLDRAQPTSSQVDFREPAFASAVAILSDGQPNRAARILALLSDDSTSLPLSADGMKGASGAVRPATGGER